MSKPSINDFVEPLSKSVIVTDTEIAGIVKELVDSISSTPEKSRERSREEIAKDVVRGVICEVGIAKLLGSRNTQKWDVEKRESFSYDVIDAVHACRHEVKHQIGDYWSFMPPVIKTLVNNIKNGGLDFIITCDYSLAANGYEVKPQCIINPLSFRNYVLRSNFKAGQFYYDHRAASRDLQCIVIKNHAKFRRDTSIGEPTSPPLVSSALLKELILSFGESEMLRLLVEIQIKAKQYDGSTKNLLIAHENELDGG